MEFKVSQDIIDKAVEPDSLELDTNHPGVNDQEYMQRRKMFFDIARKHRLENLGLPEIEYTKEEHNIWREISEKLEDAHNKSAADFYLTGKKLLGIETQHIPQLADLDKGLRQQHNMGLVPAEGLIDVRNFFYYISNRLMPCTQFLRHGSNPKYTPEPDAVHDVIGHVPPLMDKEYTDLIQLIGQGVRDANIEQLIAWQRIYWFTIEFGMIEQGDALKVYGAGILSSYGEMDYCFSDAVTLHPFDLEQVINQPFDTNVMQDILFVIPSLAALKAEVQKLIDKFKK